MNKNRNGRRWTNEEMKKLIGLWLQGKDTKEIAKKLKSTVHAVNKLAGRLRRDGIPLPRKTSGHKAGRSQKPWTQEEVEYLVRRRNDNATSEIIGEELDRSFLAVQGMIAKLRTEGVDIKMLGHGKRKLWSADKLKGAIAGRGLRLVGYEIDCVNG